MICSWLGLFFSLLKPKWRGRNDECYIRVFVSIIANSLAPVFLHQKATLSLQPHWLLFTYWLFLWKEDPTEKRGNELSHRTVALWSVWDLLLSVTSLLETFPDLFMGWDSRIRFWQMWLSPRLAGLTLDNVWVMKAIRAAVTLTCQSGDVYCQL